MTVPIILFSDHVAASSGLARITRDLATRIHANLGDTFRLATLGYGSPGSAQLPFPQYQWKERDEFLPLELPHIAKDFCNDEPFIFMTVGDVQRFLPLADTKFCRDKKFGDWVTKMRQEKRMKLWGYFPVDAHQRDGGLGPQLGHTLSHYDRRVVPGEWAKEIVKKTLPNHECDALPHGIDTSIFNPWSKEESRDEFGARLAHVMEWPKSAMDISENALWVGIVATNQNRKDWALGIAVAAELKKTRPVTLWCHTDRLKNEWSLLELLSDFGLLTSSIVTVGNVPDEVMAQSYSAMDLTLGIARGEGFGFCIAESLACGVPCITSTYGAQSDYVHIADQVRPLRMRIEGPLNLLRPIHDVDVWENAAKGAVDESVSLPAELDWNNLWPKWADWFRDGIK